jgi:hypothetical protein
LKSFTVGLPFALAARLGADGLVLLEEGGL